jgi:putative tricarboxylic transport membrane protein
MVRADFLTGVGLILLSLYILLESRRMPQFEHLGAHPLSAPGIVPAFLAVILVICGGVLVVRSVWAGGHHLGVTREGARRVLAEPGNRRLLITLVLTIGYAGGLIGRIPYALATALFVFLFVLIFEWQPRLSAARWARLLAVAAVLAALTGGVVSWVFERLFLVTLP